MRVLAALAFLVFSSAPRSETLRIFDSHLHYSHTELQRDVAERIAWKNGETLFGSFSQGH